MSVHDVDVDAVRSRTLGLGHLIAQAGEIGREDRGRQFHCVFPIGSFSFMRHGRELFQKCPQTRDSGGPPQPPRPSPSSSFPPPTQTAPRSRSDPPRSRCKPRLRPPPPALSAPLCL